MDQKSEMEVVKKVSHMNGGNGENSYANNSSLQRAVISATLPVLNDALKAKFADDAGGGGDIDACSFSTTTTCFRIVDFGCSSGANTIFTISHILNMIRDLCQRKGDNHDHDIPEFEVFLNDLPENDFNNLFKLLPSFNEPQEMWRRCSWYGLPGSFYGRLFPRNSLHFAFSCYSLHWLSQVPEGIDDNNKENIYIARTTPPQVLEAYGKQYKRDFTTFLRLRSKEMVQGGRMVFTIMGRRAQDHSMCQDDGGNFTLLASTLLDMANEGHVKMDELHWFNVPLYLPCEKEVEAVIHDEGSFNLHKLHVFPVRWDVSGSDNQEESAMLFDKYRSAKSLTKSVRAFMEPMLRSHFGFGRSIVDQVFERYAEKAAEYMSTRRPVYWNFAISLCKK